MCSNLGWGQSAAKLLRLKYEDAAPAAMIGASNHFEVAIATAVMLFGLSSGAALATVVGVLIEVPVMQLLLYTYFPENSSNEFVTANSTSFPKALKCSLPHAILAFSDGRSASVNKVLFVSTTK